MAGKRLGCYNVTYEQKREMQRLRNEGYYVKEIADIFGVSRGTVHNHTKPKYVNDGYNSLADRDMAIVKYRDEKNMTWDEIARIFRVARNTAMNGYKRGKKDERTR